jgi:putative inorganic carbon (hco3(-)) transporter
MLQEIARLKPLELIFYPVTIALIVFLLSGPYALYAILPGLGLVFLLTLGRRPQWGYNVIIFFIPLTIFRTLSRSFTVSKMLGFAIIIIVFFYLVLNRMGRFDVKSALWKWLALFVMINIFSSLLSEFPATAFDCIRQLLIACLFFLLTLIFVSRTSMFELLPKLIMLSVCISSGMAVYGYVFNVGSLTIGTDVENGLKRAVGGEIDPNAFSLLVLYALPFFVHLFFDGKRHIDRVLGGLGYLLNLVAIITSYSRGGALIFLISLALSFLIYRDRISVRHIGIVISMVAMAAVLAILLIPMSYWERQLSVSDNQDQAMMRRSSYLTFAFEKLWDRPFLGTGTGTYKDLYERSRYTLELSTSNDLRRGSHNSYIEVLIGNGLAGCLAFIIIIIVALRNFFLARGRFLARGDTEAANMVLTYLLSFIAILLYLFIIEANYHKYFWLSLGLSQVALRFASEVHDPRHDQAGLIRP